MTNSNVSEPLWLGYDTIEAWRKFVAHDFPHPSRPVAYETVKSCLGKKRLSFCEIGFGSLYDFKMCFKPLHDEGRITYTGVDFMQQFVDYAYVDYPDYTFRQGQFKDLFPHEFDITYTRHVFQHQSLDTYEMCLRKMLEASRRYAIICWHPPLGVEHEHYEFGGYCNSFDKGKVDALITASGFKIEEIPADEDVIYKLSRK